MAIKSRTATPEYRNNFEDTFSKEEKVLEVTVKYCLLDKNNKIKARCSSLEEAMDYRDMYPKDCEGGILEQKGEAFAPKSWQPASEPGAKVRVYPWSNIKHKEKFPKLIKKY